MRLGRSSYFTGGWGGGVGGAAAWLGTALGVSSEVGEAAKGERKVFGATQEPTETAAAAGELGVATACRFSECIMSVVLFSPLSLTFPFSFTPSIPVTFPLSLFLSLFIRSVTSTHTPRRRRRRRPLSQDHVAGRPES